jgi:hypothetical protein
VIFSGVPFHLIALRKKTPSKTWGVYRSLVWAARPGGTSGK